VGIIVCGMAAATVFRALPGRIESGWLSPSTLNTMHAVAQLGLILFMFLVGQDLRASRGGPVAKYCPRSRNSPGVAVM